MEFDRNPRMPSPVTICFHRFLNYWNVNSLEFNVTDSPLVSRCLIYTLRVFIRDVEKLKEIPFARKNVFDYEVKLESNDRCANRAEFGITGT